MAYYSVILNDCMYKRVSLLRMIRDLDLAIGSISTFAVFIGS